MTPHEVKTNPGVRNPGAKFRLAKKKPFTQGLGEKQGIKNQQKPLDSPGCPGGRTQGIAGDRRIKSDQFL